MSTRVLSSVGLAVWPEKSPGPAVPHVGSEYKASPQNVAFTEVSASLATYA